MHACEATRMWHEIVSWLSQPSPPLPSSPSTLHTSQDPRTLLPRSLSSPRLTIRVLNELSKCDGVVALRTALHTLEALGGGPIGGGAPFKTNPPFRFGVRHLLNLLRTIVPCVVASLWPITRAVVSADELGAPTTMSGVRAYYRQARPPLARFRLYRSPTAGARAYKELISALEIWKQRMHWRGFFTLQNMSRLGSSPAVAPAVVPNSRDLLNIETRYRHIFIPPGFPPSGQTWTSMNYLHAKVLFVNNYGIHDVHTKARATAFLWDWIGVAAHVAGTGCITVNGQFLVWARGTPAGLEKGQDLFQAALGGPPYLELEQYKGPRQ